MTEADNGQRKRSIQSTFSPWLLSLIMIYHRLPLVCLSGKEKGKVSAWAERIQRSQWYIQTWIICVKYLLLTSLICNQWNFFFALFCFPVLSLFPKLKIPSFKYQRLWVFLERKKMKRNVIACHNSKTYLLVQLYSLIVKLLLWISRFP